MHNHIAEGELTAAATTTITYALLYAQFLKAID